MGTDYAGALGSSLKKRLAKSEAKPMGEDEEEVKPSRFEKIKSKVNKFAESGGDMEAAMEDDEPDSEESMDPDEAMEAMGESIDSVEAFLEDGDVEAALDELDKLKEYYNKCC